MGVWVEHQEQPDQRFDDDHLRSKQEGSLEVVGAGRRWRSSLAVPVPPGRPAPAKGEHQVADGHVDGASPRVHRLVPEVDGHRHGAVSLDAGAQVDVKTAAERRLPRADCVWLVVSTGWLFWLMKMLKGVCVFC